MCSPLSEARTTPLDLAGGSIALARLDDEIANHRAAAPAEIAIRTR
jgi:hypothetical protein